MREGLLVGVPSGHHLGASLPTPRWPALRGPFGPSLVTQVWASYGAGLGPGAS